MADGGKDKSTFDKPAEMNVEPLVIYTWRQPPLDPDFLTKMEDVKYQILPRVPTISQLARTQLHLG
jgi:hypothetical protein